MVSYSITTPWRVLDKALDKALDSLQQSNEKIEMANVDENGELTLSGTVKGGHTRATNGLATLLALIEKKHAAEEAAKTDTPPDMPRTGHADVKPRIDTEGIKAIRSDVQNQPELSALLDVAVFTRRITVCWRTHVKTNPALEREFTKAVECKLSPEYRHLYQTWSGKQEPVPTYIQMEAWLLDKFRSKSTIFQELENFLAMGINQGESMRAFAARVKTRGAEAVIVIRSKFKQKHGTELDEESLFELLYAHAFVSTIQADSNYCRFYDRVIGDIDECKTVEDVASKASLNADREATGDKGIKSNSALAADNAALVAEVRELKVAFLAGAKATVANKQSQGTNKSRWAEEKNGKPNRADFNDPVYQAKVKNYPCRKEG